MKPIQHYYKVEIEVTDIDTGKEVIPELTNILILIKGDRILNITHEGKDKTVTLRGKKAIEAHAKLSDDLIDWWNKEPEPKQTGEEEEPNGCS